MHPLSDRDAGSRASRSVLAWLWNVIARLPYKPPDHPYGYLVAIAGMIMQMINYGLGDNFSLYIKYMTADASLGYPSATALSYNNSVSLGLSPVFGLFTGWVADRIHPRVATCASTLLLFLGLWICASYASSPMFIIFTYSLFSSIASALMLSPGAASTGSWFEKRRAVGMGINFCGGALGNLVFPPTMRKWVLRYGWRKTMHLSTSFCGLGLLATLITCRRISSESTGEPLLQHQSQNQRQQRQLESGSGGIQSAVDKSNAPKSETNGVVLGVTDKHHAHASSHELPMSIDIGVGSGSHAMNRSDTSSTASSDFGTTESSGAVVHAMHTRLITPMEVLRVWVSFEFLAHFTLFFVYGWAFYAFYYVYAQYVTVFGSKGTVYEHVPALSNAEVNRIFVTYGVFEILGSLLVGCIAAFTSNALTMVLCCTVSGMAMACLALCRTYESLMVCLVFVAFFKAGIFSVLPALINDSMYGPNLTFLMNCVFVSGSVGGFAAPPIHAQIVHHTHGSFAYSCIFMSLCITIPGFICYFCLWKNKKSVAVQLWQRLLFSRRPT